MPRHTRRDSDPMLQGSMGDRNISDGRNEDKNHLKNKTEAIKSIRRERRHEMKLLVMDGKLGERSTSPAKASPSTYAKEDIRKVVDRLEEKRKRLFHAVRENKVGELRELLFDGEVDLTWTDDAEYLHEGIVGTASSKANTSMLKTLLMSGANPFAVNCLGQNALCVLCSLLPEQRMKGHLDCIEILVSHDRQLLTTPNKDGEMPIEIATRTAYQEACLLLEKRLENE